MKPKTRRTREEAIAAARALGWGHLRELDAGAYAVTEPLPVPVGLFPSGRIVMTAKVAELARQTGLDLNALLARHLAGDGGDICVEDQRANALALIDDARIVSSYKAGTTQVLIFTDAARSMTIIHLPEDS